MKTLKELSKIQFGCYDSALPKGEILYLQLKNFDENNQFLGNVDAFVKEDSFEKYLPEYKNLDELKAHYERGGLGDVKIKKFLNCVLQEELRPIRERRQMWEQRLPEVYEILKKGSQVAADKANNTLNEVKAAMRIDYFTNENLLKK